MKKKGREVMFATIFYQQDDKECQFWLYWKWLVFFLHFLRLKTIALVK